MSKRKLLINEVFEQAKKESGKASKSGLALYLKVHLETFKIFFDEKTFSRYYDAFVLGIKKEINVDPDTLNKLSQYIGFKDFLDFSSTFVKEDEKANKTTVKISVDEDEESLSEKLSKIIINITNEQHFKMPEFVKQNGLGIMGILLIGSVLMGNYHSLGGKVKNTSVTLGFFGVPEVDKSCMFWDKNEYRLADCEDRNPLRSLIPKDTVQIKYFKRITRKDTLTVENAMGRTWYSKFNGNVAFFTMDGVDPDTGRELRSSTPYIIEKYAGQPVPVEE
ncbi:MAG: hypothetical protein MUW56_09695 [Chryseobacterium sp.]|uniref:hypothetical protein n=1 Tax=Chryseobacterium sp. TaxID=1871047 RepID=UPI0025BD5B9F|nr:hypothetical protein [Chryseobacterium sp.]MCJ7933890.1 hypothetical protein [Chryseobacterium sp.]